MILSYSEWEEMIKEMSSSCIKTYVQVNADIRADGIMLPRSLTWTDGVRYKIDRVKYIGQAPALKAGGQGDCYRIVVRGQERKIYFERSPDPSGDVIGRWFVEQPRIPGTPATQGRSNYDYEEYP